MKKIEDVFEILDEILPKNAINTILFCEVEKTAYEILYYSYFADGSCKQCNELVDEGVLNSEKLERGFEKIAVFIRDCNEYNSEKRNVVTIQVKGTSEKVFVEQFDKSTGLYRIKKEWKAVNL